MSTANFTGHGKAKVKALSRALPRNSALMAADGGEVCSSLEEEKAAIASREVLLASGGEITANDAAAGEGPARSTSASGTGTAAIEAAATGEENFAAALESGSDEKALQEKGPQAATLATGAISATGKAAAKENFTTLHENFIASAERAVKA